MKTVRMLTAVALIALIWAAPSGAQPAWETASRDALLKADWARVAESAQEWRQRDADAVVADWLLGYAGLALGDYPLATEGFQRLGAAKTPARLLAWSAPLVAEYRRNAIAQMLHGDALVRSGNYTEAMAALDGAVRLAPRSALVHNARGVVKAMSGKPAEARADFERAVARAPQFADAHANLGLLHLAQGQPEQAVTHFTTALQHAPAFALAHNGRGLAHRQLRNDEGAIADLAQASDLAPGEAQRWIETNLSWMLHDQAHLALKQQLAEQHMAGAPGQSMSFEYDEHGQLERVRDALGGETQYEYGPAGRLNRIIYPDGKWTAYEYDARGVLREVHTEHGHRIRYTHDRGNTWTQIVFPNGDMLRINRDPSARRISVAFPDGDTLDYTLDQQERLVEVRSGQQTRTMAYGPGGHLQAIQWSDGRAVNVKLDTALRLRGLTDHAQREIHRWESTLHLDAKGRVTHLSEPMGRMNLRWDDAGKLQSAATDEGMKVVVRWNETTNTPRALITSWGYVDFDTQGQPQDLYTLDGFRSPAVWREGGHLERVMSPLVGILRVQDGPDGRPTAIQFPDGQRTELTWEQDRRTHERATKSSGKHHPPSQITIYVTDMGIHNWDKQLRMFEDFRHAKAGPIIPEVTPEGQILIPMPARMPQTAPARETLRLRIAQGIIERAQRGEESTFEVRLVQRVGIPGYFAPWQQTEAKAFGQIAYEALALAKAALVKQGVQVEMPAIVGSNGAFVLTETLPKLSSNPIDRAVLVDGRAYVQATRETYQVLNGRLAVINTAGDFSALPDMIGNHEAAKRLQRELTTMPVYWVDTTPGVLPNDAVGSTHLSTMRPEAQIFVKEATATGYTPLGLMRNRVLMAHALGESPRVVQYSFPMPDGPADALQIAQGGRFWSRVQEAIDRSARLPLPSSEDRARHDAYWTQGAYWTEDPYYRDLARPAPELSPENYLKAFVLTTGSIFSSWTTFAAQVVPGMNSVVRTVIKEGSQVLGHSFKEQLRRLDVGGDITAALDRGARSLEQVGDFVGHLRTLSSLVTHAFTLHRVTQTDVLNVQVNRTILVIRPKGLDVENTRSTIRLVRHSWGDILSLDRAGLLKKAGEVALHKAVDKGIDSLLPREQQATTQPRLSGAPAMAPAGPAEWTVLPLRLHAPTGSVTRMPPYVVQPSGDQAAHVRRKLVFSFPLREELPMPRRRLDDPLWSCRDLLCPPPANRHALLFPPRHDEPPVVVSDPPDPPGGGGADRRDPPPPPPAASGGSLQAGSRPVVFPPALSMPRQRQPSEQVSSAPPSIDRSGSTLPPVAKPPHRLPSQQPSSPNPGGVLMTAEVVKNQPADMTGIFGGASHTPPAAPQGTQTATPQPTRLFAPFLLFSAVEVAQ